MSSIIPLPSVVTEVSSATAWTHTFTNTQLSAIRLRLKWPSLFKQEDDGDLVGYSINYAIDLQTDGGTWQTVLNTSVTGKTTSGYERSHRIDLSDLQTVGTPGANGGINIDQTLSGSWAVAPAQLGQTIIVNNSTQPPTIYTINAYSSCRFDGANTRINAGGTSTGAGSPGGGTNTGISLTAINTAAYD
ncbi:TipJ family phage tail tip protein [Escherichia coli]|uniref:TipJ family phage tail tip protein n=1 Tax=Escherichia coli TaxID=562 RepID=UPI0020741CE8|nr:hypothetical protein [Escherichia coli]